MATPLEEIDLVRANPQASAEQEAVVHLGDRILTLDRRGGAVRRVEDERVGEPEWYPQQADALAAANLHGVDGDLAKLLGTQTEAFYRQDIDRLVSLWTENAEIHPDPTWPEQAIFRGQEGIRRFYTEMFAILGSGRYVIEEARAAGEVVLMRTRQKTSGVASGIPIENRFVNLLWLSEGLCRRLQFYRDEEEGEKAFAAAAG